MQTAQRKGEEKKRERDESFFPSVAVSAYLFPSSILPIRNTAQTASATAAGSVRLRLQPLSHVSDLIEMHRAASLALSDQRLPL